MSKLLILDSSDNINPIIKPTRDQIINVKANFCNLFDSEGIPIFDGFIDWLILNNQAKAEDWVNVLKSAGTTHITLDLSGDYDENLGWIDRYPIPGMDWTKDLDGFAQIIEWVQNRGFIPFIKLALDGQGNGPDYNVPQGMTYGWEWGMNNMPKILPAFNSFHNSCLWSTGWDGCFPDWDRDQTIGMLQLLRRLLGDEACIDTEFSGPGSVGYSHMGRGPEDWTENSLGILDNFSIEVNSYPANEVGLQQTAARLLGPNKKNIQPENDGPDYLAYISQIKKINICLFEDIAYQAIRKQVSLDDIKRNAQICAKYGFTSFGNGQP